MIRNGKEYNKVKTKGIEAYLLTGEYYLTKVDLTKKQNSFEEPLKIGYQNGYGIEL